MRKSSIHIEKGNLGYCFHNTRQKPTANSIFSTINNAYDNNAIKAIEIYRTELKKREKAYTKRTCKKLNKNTITHLSAIVNLNETHSLDDVKKVAEYLEDTLGTKVFQIAIHRDEGYIDNETNKKKINEHAHLEMIGLDEQGNSIRRKLTRSYLINLQSKVAEILNMQRGINYTKERKKRPKRLDTYEYKEYAKRKTKELKPVLQENKKLKEENKELKLTKKELEKQISELRKRMIEFNKQLEKKEFTQEDYKYLSSLKKALKANNLKEIYIKLKEFDKSVSDRMLKFKEYTQKLEEENKKLKNEIGKLQNKLLQSENRVQELEEENEKLKEQLELLQKAIKEQKEQIAKETAELSSKNKIEINIANYFTYALSDSKDKFNCNVKLVTEDNQEHNYSTFVPSYESVAKIKKAIIEKEHKYTLIDDLKEDKIYVTNLSNNEEDVREMILNAINLMLKKGHKLEDINYHTKSERNLQIFNEIKEYLLNKSAFNEKKEIKSESVSNNFSFKFKR